MRTVIAPLHPEVEAELAALDARLQDVARRYIRRLAVEPYLGYPVGRGSLGTARCRAVRFDHGDDPGDLFGSRGGPVGRRRGSSRGPRWRIVYWVRETRDRRLRIVVVLGVGVAHPQPGQRSAFELAARLLQTITKEKK